MGSPPYYRSHDHHDQLGDGVQALVPQSESAYLLWLSEREEAQASRLEQGKFIPCLHYFVQACDLGPFCFQTKEMVLDEAQNIKNFKSQRW
jgi:hypothetical protein